jgi:membrane protease YdiL (CAAX protease family)
MRIRLPALQPAPTNAPPPIWPAFVAYAIAFALLFVASAVIVFGFAWSRSDGSVTQVTAEAAQFAVTRAGIMASALISAVVLMAVALCAARLQSGDVRSALRLGPTTTSVPGIIAAVLGMIGLSVATGAAADLLGARRQGTMEVIAHALARPTGGRLLLAIATIAIAPAIAEETFFRGLIQGRLARRWRRWPSIAVTAAGFALIHLDPAQGAVAFVAGLFLGWLVERFGGIRPSMVAHACNNAAFVVIASFGSSEDASRAEDIGAIAAGMCTWAACTVLLRSRVAVARSDAPP